jgi:hypothetical protein
VIPRGKHANRLSRQADWSDSTEFDCVAVSPVFLVLLAIFFYNIFTESLPPSFSDDTGAFYWCCFWLAVASACFLTLAWITFTAGLDLWRLKNRGRNLAYISMIPFLPLGIGFLLSYDIWRKMLGAAFCTFGGFFLAYLQRPTILQTFALPPPDLPR